MSEKKEIEVKNLSLKTLGIKSSSDDWFNFSKKSEYSEEDMKGFLKEYVENGDTVRLELDDDGYYRKVHLTENKSFSKGSEKRYRNENVADDDTKRIMKQVALKSAVEYCKDGHNNINDVLQYSDKFYNWLKGDL